MPKRKLEHKFVYNYYKEHNYIMHNVYGGCMKYDQLTCPVGHEIKILFNNFKNKGSRCFKCFGSEKYSHDYVFEFHANENYTLNSIYKNCMTKNKLICPVGHEIQISFNSFQNGHRCGQCAGVSKLSHEYVLNFYNSENYIMNSIYINSRTKDQLTCPVGHNIEMTFNSFENGNRCLQCFHATKYGETNPNWNPNREELPLNQRLRKTFKKDWITKYMKHDPKYQEFLSNKDAYAVDHIIPVKLFCELTVKYGLNEYKIKNIINHIDNLQLLTVKDNRDKWYKGSSLFEAANYLINNGIQFENFQTIAV